MKRLVWIITYAVILMMGSCDETTEKELIDSLTEGKLVLKIDNEEVMFEKCTWMNFGGTALAGEIFIQGIPNDSVYEPYCSIFYGSYENTVTMSARSYSTGNANDLISFSSSYGSVDETNTIEIKIIEINTTTIKGNFEGKISTDEGSKEIEGAFWATKFEHPTY